jgi:hypothetical protein
MCAHYIDAPFLEAMFEVVRRRDFALRKHSYQCGICGFEAPPREAAESDTFSGAECSRVVSVEFACLAPSTFLK